MWNNGGNWKVSDEAVRTAFSAQPHKRSLRRNSTTSLSTKNKYNRIELDFPVFFLT